MERERMSTDRAKLKTKEDLMKEWGKEADRRLEMVLKCEGLDLEKWKSIQQELRKATSDCEVAQMELTRAEEAQDELLVQFEDDETVSGSSTPLTNYEDIIDGTDSDSDTDSNDDYSSDDEDDFSHFYNYSGEGESTTTIDQHEFQSSPKPARLRPATPELDSDDDEIIDRLERTWTLDEYEAYLKRAVENYDETRERYALKEAREKFLNIVRPRKQGQLARHPCILTVIPNRPTRPSVPDPEHLPIPTIRLTTPAGTQLTVEPQLSPLPNNFDEYVQERDAAQDDMQYYREEYFSGEPSTDFEKRLEKENRIESMKQFHSFMERENISYPNFSEMEKIGKDEDTRRPPMTVILDTITEDPEEEAATLIEDAKQRVELCQQRLDKALKKEKEFKDILIPATIQIREEIKKEMEVQAEKQWQNHDRYGYFKKAPRAPKTNDNDTAYEIKSLLVKMLIGNEYRVDPTDSLRFISTTGETVSFEGRLREQPTWAYPISLLPTAINYAQQYKLLTPAHLEKDDTYEVVRLISKEAGPLKNLRRVSKWYADLKAAAKLALRNKENAYTTAWNLVMAKLEQMHEVFPALPCEESQVPKEKEDAVRDLCATAEEMLRSLEASKSEEKAKGTKRRRPIKTEPNLQQKKQKLSQASEGIDNGEDMDIVQDATTQVELPDQQMEGAMEQEERQETPKRTRKHRSFREIFGSKKEPKRRTPWPAWMLRMARRAKNIKIWKMRTKVNRGSGSDELRRTPTPQDNIISAKRRGRKV